MKILFMAMAAVLVTACTPSGFGAHNYPLEYQQLYFVEGSANIELGDKQFMGDLELLNEYPGADARLLSLGVVTGDEVGMTFLEMSNQNEIDPLTRTFICTGTMEDGEPMFDRDEQAYLADSDVISATDEGVTYTFETQSETGLASGVAYFEYE